MNRRAPVLAAPVVAATGLACALLAAAVLLAACGSTRAGTAAQATAGQRTLPLATSVVSTSGTSYAIVEMGGSAAQENNFWQLFARPARGSAWQLATPLGVADNGGLIAAPTGATSMLTGFRPSQDLLFSPLATTTDAGTSWSPANPLPGGLANVPGSLAAGPGGQLIALTDAGQVLAQDGPGAAWSTLTTLRLLAAMPAGRPCGLTGLTAVGFSPAGTPLVAGDCSRAGAIGIFESTRALQDAQNSAATAKSWRLTGPGHGSDGATAILDLATVPVSPGGGSVTTAVIRIASGRSAWLAAAWLRTDGQWSVSAKLPIGSAAVLSAALWPGGALGVVLSGGQAAVLTGGASGWQHLPALPADTAALATEPGGLAEALTAVKGTFRAFELKSGSWQLEQTVKVAIPYGSSS
ncbi:MAG TPA: hypothetical protein VEL03_12265 [Streptosporangiaceae bacterium]|nr:hypothetical protein [Streptosporangiaceae bacterium]